ncbi:MAG TPA: aminoglycoside phosphotransferase family protein [Candidatus Elarobacter sp.]
MDATLLCRTATSELYVEADGSIVKRSGVLAPSGNVLGRREVDFYRYVRRLPDSALPVPVCYHASYDGDGDGGRLALEKLRAAADVPVSRHDALVLAIDALASIHAAFWGSTPLPWTGALPLAGSGVPDAGTLSMRLERACWRTPRILSDEDALIVGDVIASGVVAALARPVHRTLTHADLHVDNVFFRVRGQAVEAVVIDWQLYEAGIGPCDLAHLLVSGLEPPDRRAAEDVLVERYHAGLVAAGVREYSLDACITDYRLGLVRQVLVLLGLSENGVPTSVHADRALAAYRDVGVGAA